MRERSKQSKVILTRLLVLYEHLDRLRDVPKPRPEQVQLAIDALYVRIEREKKKLRKLRN